MMPVLFTIPLHDWIGTSHPWLDWVPNIPLHGYGLMLFFAFIFCYLLAHYLCRFQGIDGDLMLDLTIWLFVFGIVGGRIVFVMTEWDKFQEIPWKSVTNNKWYKMAALWDGGLVFYGAMFGGAVGYFAYHYIYLRPKGVSHWKMLDVIAPCIALGAALGRIGCLFTGCCYGNVAGTECPAVHFPLLSAPTMEMVKRGYQTPLGFSFRDRTNEVEVVEPGYAAAEAGLEPGDVIFDLKINGFTLEDLLMDPEKIAKQSVGNLSMKVLRGDVVKTLEFEPRSIGLNPTQLYETISMVLLLFFLLSYFPFRRWDGELMVILMFGYAVHRYLNEMLRTDTEKVAFNLTLSQNISIAIIAGAIVLAFLVYRRPRIGRSPALTEVHATVVS